MDVKATIPVEVSEIEKGPPAPAGSLASIHSVYADPYLPNKVRYFVDSDLEYHCVYFTTKYKVFCDVKTLFGVEV